MNYFYLKNILPFASYVVNSDKTHGVKWSNVICYLHNFINIDNEVQVTKTAADSSSLEIYILMEN